MSMAARLSVDFLEFEFPQEAPPPWHAQVERWYQMDAPSFGLCELWSKVKTAPQPNLILLASAGGSAMADFQFVKGGANSPAKFVHTLPSIRSSALLQLMGWHGPLLCLQNDPASAVAALREAAILFERGGSIWVLGYVLEPGRANVMDSRHCAYRFGFADTGPFELVKKPESEICGSASLVSDAQLLRWLRSQESPEAEGDLSLGTLALRRNRECAF